MGGSTNGEGGAPQCLSLTPSNRMKKLGNTAASVAWI